MKRRAGKVSRRAVAEPANDIRMADFVERYGFVLKILGERLFKLGVGRALQGDVERFDDDRLVCVALIVGDKDFGIAAATEQARHEVAIINYAVFEF